MYPLPITIHGLTELCVKVVVYPFRIFGSIHLKRLNQHFSLLGSCIQLLYYLFPHLYGKLCVYDICIATNFLIALAVFAS